MFCSQSLRSSACCYYLQAANIGVCALDHCKHGVPQGWVCEALRQGRLMIKEIAGCPMIKRQGRDVIYHAGTFKARLLSALNLNDFIKLSSFQKIFLLVGLKEHYLLYITFLQLKVVLRVSLIVFSLSQMRCLYTAPHPDLSNIQLQPNPTQDGLSTSVTAALSSPVCSATQNPHPWESCSYPGIRRWSEPMDTISALKFGFANFCKGKTLPLIVPRVSG